MGAGRGRRDLRHGLRLPHRRVRRRRVHRPAVGPRLRPRRHRPRVHGPRQPVADHPRPAVVRPGVVDRRRRPRARRRSAAPSTATAPPSTTRTSSPSWPSTAAGGTPVERSPYVAYRRQNCTSAYGCVTSWRQVYYDDVASLKQRYAIVNDYGLRGAGMWALGLRRRPLRAVPRAAPSRSSSTSPPRRPASGSRRRPRATRGSSSSWAARDTSGVASYDVQVSVDGGAVGDVAARDPRDVRRLAGRATGHGYAFRVRAIDRKGNAGAWNVGATWDASPSLATGGFGRVVDRRPRLPRRSRHERGEARHAQGRHDRRDHARPGVVGRLRLVRGHRADPRVVAGVVRGARRLDRGEVVLGHDGQALPGAQQHHGRRRDPPASTSGPGRDPRSARVRGAGDPRVLAERRRVARTRIRLRWTQRRRARLAHAQRLPHQRRARRVARRARTAAPARRRGTGTARRGAAPSGTGATSCSWSGAPAAGRSTRRRGRPTTLAQVAAFGVTVDTVAPTVRSASASTTLISPNGDGNHDAVRLAMTSSGATRWALLSPRRPARSGPPTAAAVRSRSPGAASGTTARASPTAATRPRWA